MNCLKEHIKSYSILTENEIDNIVSSFYPMTIERNGYFLQIGQLCYKIAFVKSGLFRLYHLNEDGEEVTTYFSKPKTFITSHDHFDKQTKTNETIQAIIQSELLVIDKTEFENILKNIPTFQTIIRNVFGQVATELKKKNALLQELSADKRYNFLMENEPFFIQNVPLNYLASYLGITPQHLSRIRKKTI